MNDPELPLWTFYRNSLFVALTNVVITLFTSSVLGYIFAKYVFRGRDVLFWYLMALMMVPASVLMIPNYLILSELGLLNNLWGLVVTAAIDPFAILVMRQFIRSLPDEQIESARVDGASEFRIYRSVVLPQVKPALATLGLLTFMFHWNAYLWPLIVLTENRQAHDPGDSDLVLHAALRADQPGDGGVRADGDPGAHLLRRHATLDRDRPDPDGRQVT